MQYSEGCTERARLDSDYSGRQIERGGVEHLFCSSTWFGAVPIALRTESSNVKCGIVRLLHVQKFNSEIPDKEMMKNVLDWINRCDFEKYDSYDDNCSDESTYYPSVTTCTDTSEAKMTTPKQTSRPSPNCRTTSMGGGVTPFLGVKVQQSHRRRIFSGIWFRNWHLQVPK
ncbi:hypothetical protein AVEN_24965-1 [Araneus ventricosus]|uniref:Uncharacterized protein n=1 Tax=Araneus ventricosus TaxID=182803 RepID=A0A4Y2G4Z3_ARAVE|nr:hypothetical protein AVEN_24965-1 [Araneus ventricosus]